MNLGKKIKQKRDELNLTQEELAAKVNLSRSTVALIESGKRGVTRDKIESFARALNMPPAELMGWTESSRIDATSPDEDTKQAIDYLNFVAQHEPDVIQKAAEYAKFLSQEKK